MTARPLHHTTRVRERTAMTLRLLLLAAFAAAPAAAQTVPVPHKAPKSAASVRSSAAAAATPRLVVASKFQPALRSAAAPGTVTVVAPTLGARPAKARAVAASAPPRLDLGGAKGPKPGARR